MNHLRFFIVLTAALLTSQAHGFMNIEQIRQSSKGGTSGAVGLKINGQTGNSKKLLSEATTLTLQRNGRSEYLLAGLYRYGQSRDVKDTHLGNIHLRYTREFSSLPAGEVFLQTEFDQFKRLARRDVLGAGLRQLLDRSDENSLYVGLGAFRENERFSDNLIGHQQAFRGNAYISFVRSFNELVSGSATVYVQPNLGGVSDVRLQVDSALQVKLARYLSFSLEWDMQADTRPPPGVKKVDTTYLAGLSFNY